MRRSQLLALTLAALLVLAPSGRAEDEDPKREGMTPERVARLILLGGEAQQTFVAQHLQSADRDTLLAVQRALRALAPEVAEQMKAEAARQAHTPPEQGPFRVVTIETRVIQVKDGDDLLGDVGDLAAPGTNFVLLDATQMEVILRAIERSERVEQITAPRITVYDGQRANVSLLNQVSYIQDYEVEISTEAVIADPIVGVVQEGLLVDLRPVVSADGKHVTLDVDVTWAELQRPILERQLLLKEGGEAVTIQLPSIDIGTAHATATVPSGRGVLLASRATFGNGKERVVRYALVTAEVSMLETADLRKAVQPASGKRRDK